MFNRGGFPGQRPMGHGPMNQPGMNHPGMNMSGMNMPGMNMSGMGMSPMNQPNMNLSGMNHPGMNHQRMGGPGMNHPNIGLTGMNQPNMNLNRMNHPGMNQGGGMGFLPEMKNQAFGMRPMDNTGSFGGNTDPIGMKGMPVRSPMHSSSDRLMGPQVLPQRFASPNLPMHQGQPRMPAQNQEIPSIVNRVLTHSSDRMIGKPKAPLQEPAHHMKEKQWDNVNVFGNVGQEMGMKPVPSGSPMNQASSTQNRYTNESASSILESFGLSNEDLEELSRYPDDQLTPSNMPGILRDIRLRKMNRTTSVPDQAAGRRPGSDTVPSKVIDYGHSSKYQFNKTAAPARSYDPPRTEQKPPPVPKETTAPSITKHEKSPQKGMDNKIPTISGSRKPSWPSSKPDRSNNKTLVGEDPKAPVDVSVTVPNVEKPVISIQADATTIPDVAAPVQAEMKQKVTVVTGVAQVTYLQPADPPAAGKGSWVPVLSQEEAQKMKRLPTPSMMNDYYAASPRIFPHICSLCNVECRHLKDWIKHQNNASHIESCRNLRQQYPDWNPQVLSSVSKKDEATSKQSKSKSASPRRSRRSGSRHRARKSRSRSPRSGRRSRSRSPRRPRYSPKKSRSPRRGPRSPNRSRSPRRHRRSSHSNSPDKKAVDAAVQNFIEASKQKSGDKAKSAKPSNNGKKAPPKPSNSNVKSKKPASSAPPPKKPGSTSSSSSSSKKQSSNNNSSDKKPASNSAARKPPPTSSAAKKPSSASSNYKKPVVSTGAKKTNVKPQPSKPSTANPKTPGSPTTTSKETFNPLNKFTSKNNPGKIIHVTNLPDSGYTDQDILKIVQPFGKVCDILIVRSKNEAFMETNFREAAAAAVKFSESTAVMINNQRVTLSLAGQSKKPVKIAEKGGKLNEEPSKASAQPDKSTSKAPLKKVKAPTEKEEADKKPVKSKHDLEIPPGFVRCYKLDDPPLRENEKCVILISNLPEGQYTVDEIANLAKPFGGVNDILIVANHRKAYLELTSKNSVDSLIKFYNVFPTYLSGNLLSICVAQRYKDLKDEDLIFADLIEQASYKITPSIYEKFVYLKNLPEKDVEEFEILRVGLRFGKVEHYVLLSNKKKAILHLHTENAAKAMHSFLSQYPCSIGENIVQCALPSKTKLAEDEYITYVEVEKQSTDSDIEKTASAADKSTEPDKKEEKLSSPQDEESKVKAVSTPVSQSEMDVDTADAKGTSAPPQSTEDEVESDSSSAQDPAKPPSSGSFASCYMVVATEDDDEDDEEAAEAPEAPDTSPLYVQAEPEAQRHEAHPVSQQQVSEELDVLVSVESDEEESEEQHHTILSTKRGPQPLPVTEKDKLLNTETSTDEDTSHSPEFKGKEATKDSQKVRSEDVGKKMAENSDIEGPSTDQVQDSTESSKLEETKDPNMISAGKAELSSTKEGESKLNANDEGAKSVEEISKPSDPVPTLEVPEMGQVAVTSSVSMVRTTKYNAQKGEISVTVTLDSQKSNVKTPESKKRTSRERGTSAHESSMPRSNSNRSSPADSASSHTKSASNFSQKKSTGKYFSSQTERDSKDLTRPRERETRSSSRKDDRTRGSNSSRYTRSSKTNSRSPRSKEEEEETFPFNLDEFVTVDEIVEEHGDSKNKAEAQEEKPDAARKGKRKENDPVPLDAKKSRVTSTDSHKPSFVTLDEVGDEEENAGIQENLADQTAQSLVTLDEVHAEDGPPASAKEEQMLMTLDEISDDDDAQDSSTGQRSTTNPEILTKDQLLTLDEVNDEDEEHTPPTEPSSVTETKSLEDPKHTKVKEEDGDKELEAKHEPEVPQEAPAKADQGDHLEQPLLTLDEVKADDDEMSFADIEHQFLTVDEIGEEEEESETKAKENEPKADEGSKTSEAKDSSTSKACQPTTPAKKGRPRKRPLQSAEGNKDSSQQAPPDTSKGAAPKKTPAKPSKDSEQGTADGAQDGSSAPSDKPESAEGKPGAETPAKKTKLESPPAEKTKLAPFNPSTPVGLEYLVPKTGYFCELCSLFYMDDSSKLKHCRSLRHYQAVEKHLAKSEAASEGKSPST